MRPERVHVQYGCGEDIPCNESVHGNWPAHGISGRCDCVVMSIYAMCIDTPHGNLIAIVDDECSGVRTNGPIILRRYE
jgi:hypothetical protein